jgi:hypothetical protein
LGSGNVAGSKLIERDSGCLKLEPSLNEIRAHRPQYTLGIQHFKNAALSKSICRFCDTQCGLGLRDGTAAKGLDRSPGHLVGFPCEQHALAHLEDCAIKTGLGPEPLGGRFGHWALALI